MPAFRQNRHFTAEEGTALVAAWQRRPRDEGRRDFCRRLAIGPWILSYWLKRLALRESSGFVQVASSGAVSAVEASVGVVRLQIRPGFDPALLRAVVSCLAELSC